LGKFELPADIASAIKALRKRSCIEFKGNAQLLVAERLQAGNSTCIFEAEGVTERWVERT
jgi:hypothetical protein